MTPAEIPIVLRDGTHGVIRDLRAEDKAVLQAGYEQLSPESRFHRFLSPIPRLTGTMLRYLVDNVDFVDHVALGMLVENPGGADGMLPIAVARIIRYPDCPDAADVAVTVTDEFHNRGVATVLLAELVRRRPAGVRRLVTMIAADNRPSLAMLRRLGETTISEKGDGVLGVEVRLPEEVTG